MNKHIPLIMLASSLVLLGCVGKVRAESGIDAKADAVMHKVSDFYSKMKTTALTMDVKMQVEQDGKPDSKEMSFNFEYERPNLIRCAPADGNGMITVSDGKKLSVYQTELKKYKTVDAPASVHGAFAIATGGMSGMSMLSSLLSDNPYDAMTNGASGGKLIGVEKIDGVETQHLHLDQKDVARDIWVQQGDQPWIKRVIPDVASVLAKKPEFEGKNVKASLQFDFKGEKSDPKIAAADFVFTPPAGSTELVVAKREMSPEGPHPLLKKEAPPIVLDTLSGGKFDLSNFKSKDVVVLDFWATWCGPCRRALPILAEVTKSYKDKGVQFYAVNEQEDPDKINEYLKSQKLDINVALDRKGTAGQDYKASGIPQTVIVGKDGIVKVVHIGFSDNLKSRLSSELDAILAGKEPPAE